MLADGAFVTHCAAAQAWPLRSFSSLDLHRPATGEIGKLDPGRLRIAGVTRSGNHATTDLPECRIGPFDTSPRMTAICAEAALHNGMP
jgi:hypothetical protein